MASRKTALLSRTLSDIVSQQPAGVMMTQATLTNVFNAATAVLAPFSPTPARMSDFLRRDDRGVDGDGDDVWRL